MIEKLVRRAVNPKWIYTQSGQAAIALQDGLKQLSDLFGTPDYDDERIVDYIVYQIYVNRGLIESGRWNVGWLFYPRAMDKYKRQFMSEDGKSGINYYIDQWLDDFELSRDELTAMIAKPKPNPMKGMVYLESEEPLKKRFLNTPEGLAFCQESTTGWSPLSDTCGKCDNWVECGKMTAKKYPELMRLRKEEYGKQKERQRTDI